MVFEQHPATWNIRLERLDKDDGINAIPMAHMAYTMHLCPLDNDELEDTALLTKLIEGD